MSNPPAPQPAVVQSAAAAPTFSPPPGTFAAPLSVTLASATPNATIHFTTDGSTPTTASPLFTAPISVSATTTITAIATATGFSNSVMATGTYTIIPPVAPPPPPPPPPPTGSPGVLSYATYLGGSGADGVSAMTVDAAGNAYLAGSTSSTDFPVTAGAFQTTSNAGSTCGTAPQTFVCTAWFVAKLDPSGSKLLYSTFFPGVPSAIAVSGTGEVYVAGAIDSSVPFPVTAGALNGTGNLFVAKLNSTGSTLLIAARFGSTGLDHLTGMALDSLGNVYVTGWSFATDYLVTPGAFQTTTTGAFLTKISADGTAMLYSARLGGSDSANRGGFGTQPNSVAVVASGQAFVAGTSDSPTFPTTATAFQTAVTTGAGAFLTEVSADGSALLYSTLFGGGTTEGFRVALDNQGAAYITGKTHGFLTFPLTPGVFQSGFTGVTAAHFVAKFNPSLAGIQSLLFSTYVDGPNSGGAGATSSGLAVDATGNVYVTGFSDASAFPTTPNGLGGCSLGTQGEVFLSVLNPRGSGLLFGTLVGGSAGSLPAGLGMDSLGNVYLAGTTSASNFPVTAGALRAVNTGADGFALRINASTVTQLVNAPPPPQWQICSPADGATLDTPSVSVDSVLQATGIVSPAQVTVTIDGTTVKQFANQGAISTVQPIGVGPHTITVSATTGTQTVSKTVTVNGTTNPFPQTSSISPTTVAAGGPGFTLSVSGTNFVSSSVVQWNGTNLATTFVSSGSLTAAVPASLITALGTANIAVFNPAPGGGLSASVSLMIQ